MLQNTAYIIIDKKNPLHQDHTFVATFDRGPWERLTSHIRAFTIEFSPCDMQIPSKHISTTWVVLDVAASIVINGRNWIHCPDLK